MPPKKKPKKKKGKGNAKTKTKDEEEKSEWDELDTNSLTEVVKAMQQDLAKIQKQRNYEQIECDTVQHIFDATQKEIANVEMEIEAKEHEMDEVEEDHRIELRVYENKVRHLNYMHMNNIKEVCSEGQAEEEELKDLHANCTMNLLKAKQKLRKDIMDLEVKHVNEVQAFRVQEEEDITNTSNQLDEDMDTLQMKHKKHERDIKDELELKMKMEIHETEERKNLHINEIMCRHKDANERMRSYYKERTKECLDKINSLQEEVSELNKKAEQRHHTMSEMEKENRCLAEPLSVAQLQVADLKLKLRSREKDQRSLNNSKARLLMAEKKTKVLRKEYFELQSAFELVERERDELKHSLQDTTSMASKKSELKSLILEQKIQDVSRLSERPCQS